MSQFAAGFARLDITPPLGVRIPGYYQERIGNNILDPILATAIAVSDGDRTAVLITTDLIGIAQDTANDFAAYAAQQNGIPSSAVFIACTHTHTGPVVFHPELGYDPDYNAILKRKLSDVVYLAIADLKPARVAIGKRILKDIAFVRRFQMKDGTIQTWANRHDPNVEKPTGLPDEWVQLVRIEREGGAEILLVNFQVHPDVISGCAYSADYPKFVRDTLEKSLDNVRCAYFNGAEGELNHVNINSKPWDKNKGYAYAEHMGRSIAGAALQIYGNMEPLESGSVFFDRQLVKMLSSRDNSRLSESERIIALNKQGRDAELGPDSVATPAVAEAYRIKRLENGPDVFMLNISVVAFCNVAFVGLPGEPFSDIGRKIKEASPYAMTCVCCLTNGNEGYLPTKKAFEEGGYEPRSSKFKIGVGEALVEKALEILNRLKRLYQSY